METPSCQHFSLRISGHHGCESTNWMLAVVDVQGRRKRDLDILCDPKTEKRTDHRYARAPHQSSADACITRAKEGSRITKRRPVALTREPSGTQEKAQKAFDRAT